MLRARQRFDKYRIVRRVAEGGFAYVYEAHDTIEDVRVALKIPRPSMIGPSAIEDFKREVRLMAKLDHPNILHIKNAGWIQDYFVIVTPLAEQALSDRMRHRMGVSTVISYMAQMLAALDHAHQRNIIHCDLKPDNMLIYADDRLRVADFGIAKFAQRTLSATRSGTLGYLSPEQAMGRPRKASDVFSLGLMFYEMLTKQLPEWPFDWPPRRLSVAKAKLPPAGVEFLRRAIEVDVRRRFTDACEMHRAFLRIRPALLAWDTRRRRRSTRS